MGNNALWRRKSIPGGKSIAQVVKNREYVYPQESSGNPEVSAEKGVNKGNDGARKDGNTTETSLYRNS